MNPMFNAMDTVALESWCHMETGIAHEIGPGEETLTDINLLKLCLRIPTLRVKKYDKKAESRNGADWEWWIGSSRDKRWIQLRVQAKRSSHAGLHYSSLGYDVARREARDGEGDAKTVKQFDALIAQSAIDGAIPLHVFFNGWPENRFLGDVDYLDYRAMVLRAIHDGFWEWPISSFVPEYWGCTIASTHTVKEVFIKPEVKGLAGALVGTALSKDRLYVPHYLANSTPWSHLFRSRTPGAVPTVREVAENIQRIQGDRRPLSDEAFNRMTSPAPSDEAQKAAYGAYLTQKSAVVIEEKERRRGEHRQDAMDFIASLDYAAENLLSIFNTPEEERWHPTYRLLLDLNPEESELAELELYR
ncbi:hypothetical protein GS979_07110 [Rhodococcus hoagii]|nr:hypothetical protein [Prescottella equi]NKW46180.1 hypothetical protein [Prescottella equi]